MLLCKLAEILLPLLRLYIRITAIFNVGKIGRRRPRYRRILHGYRTVARFPRSRSIYIDKFGHTGIIPIPNNAKDTDNDKATKNFQRDPFQS